MKLCHIYKMSADAIASALPPENKRTKIDISACKNNCTYK